MIPLTPGSPPDELGSSAGYWGSILPAVWSFQLAARSRPGVTIVDTRNLLDPAEVRAAGFGYDGVGRR